DRVAILDPGPDDRVHRAALLAAVAGRPVDAILLTHTHKDHSAGAKALQRETSAPLWFAGPHRLSRKPHLFEMNALAGACDWGLTPDRAFFDGEQFGAGGVDLVAIATPGHCANHMSYGIAGTDWLLTGDHVMGWNSTLVAVPDGSMADYFASLEKVIALPCRRYVPAHGGPIADGPTYATALRAHRQLRNQQVLAAVSAGARTVPAIVAAIYPAQPLPVRRAAGMTITAHVEYLEGLGQLRVRRSLLGTSITGV